MLAHKGVETFFTQVFEHKLFHADMHPGNIQVDITDPTNPSYIALDCAIVGSLDAKTSTTLHRTSWHSSTGTIARLSICTYVPGWIPATRCGCFLSKSLPKSAIPIFNKPLSEISFADFMTQLLRTAADFNMEIQPQLVLLQKTLLYIEGLGRQLYPELDLWSTALPLLQRWATRNFGPLAVITQILEQTPELASNLYRLPELLRQDTLPLRIELAKQNQVLIYSSAQRTYAATSGSALGLSSSSPRPWPQH